MPLVPSRRARLAAMQRVAQCTHALYVQCERLRARWSLTRPLSILVSDHYPVWESAIRNGFAASPHSVRFGALEGAALDTFDLIVPLSLADARVLRSQDPSVRARAVPMPSESLTQLCHDKPRLNQWLIDHGLGRHVPAMGADLAPPFICKPAHGENSHDCHIVPDTAALDHLRDVIAQPGLFRQAAVRGRVEYATHFLARNGRLQRTLTVAYHHASELCIKGQGSAGQSVRSIAGCPDRAALSDIVAALRYDGLGCVNYKVADTRLQLLEINPRFGGSLAPYFFAFLRSLPQLQGTGARPAREFATSRLTSPASLY